MSKKVVRETDQFARIGGDEFGKLAIEIDKAGSDMLLLKILQALSANEIKVSVGKAIRNPEYGLIKAIE